MPLCTPALAERAADVPVLAARFLRNIAPQARLSADAMQWLQARDWPGNVRQLRAVVESAGALIMPGSDLVDAELLRFVNGDDHRICPTAQPAAAMRASRKLPALTAWARWTPPCKSWKPACCAKPWPPSPHQFEAARCLPCVGLDQKLARLGLK